MNKQHELIHSISCDSSHVRNLMDGKCVRRIYSDFVMRHFIYIPSHSAPNFIFIHTQKKILQSIWLIGICQQTFRNVNKNLTVDVSFRYWHVRLR